MIRLLIPWARMSLRNNIGIRGRKIRELRSLIASGHLQLEPRRKCQLCGHSCSITIAKFDRYAIPVEYVCCKACSFIQASAVFSEDSNKEFYSNHYRYLQEGGTPDQVFNARFNRQVRNGKRILMRLQPQMSQDGLKKVVEIGSGAGGLVSVFLAAGFDVSGFDIDPSLLEIGKKRYGLPLQRGKFSASENSVDVIILRHVVEHLSDPSPLLTSVGSALRPGGLLYVEVPGIRQIFRGKYQFNILEFFLLPHVAVYELRTLRQMITKYGFIFLRGDESIFGVFQAPELSDQSLSQMELPYEPPDNLLTDLRKVEYKYWMHWPLGKLSLVVNSTKKLWKTVFAIRKG